MDKSTKLYTKAVNYYNDGYIDKSLEYCEKSISENLKNSSAINLKGLLYYLKGDLNNAQALWKMNFEVNKDLVSKKYLEDSKDDKEKQSLYELAVKKAKEVRIKEALKLLEECKKSDFNSINVNNCIALCAIKTGEYKKALKAIDEVLKIDKENKIALGYKKELIKFGIIEKKFKIKYINLSILIIGFIVIFTVISRFISSPAKVYNKPEIKENNLNITSKNISDIQQKSTVDKQEEKKEEAVELFPSEDIKKALESKNYDKLYTIFFKWQGKELNVGDKYLLVKTEEIIKDGGVEYFYNRGREAAGRKNYDEAIDYLTKAYNIGSSSYLYSHVIYFLGFSYESKGDIEKALKYYKEYDSKYPSGDYEDTVLYELALIYKNIDNDAARNYAEKLVKAYPKSIYNNSIIKGILKRN
ncbi:tetratricopeptide repeat protein [Clostridium sp. SYSU_GA19001]|uniref:tetratricopeptide repeat protein n=1 Tax=Clostridium caldaquaticum TaxID=2940653 RepID=UPI0020777D8E|nr:tetratricopeptide repeat protein [Clostridium caldaquaticum]MCM8710745.1 tetratricopeptide repeat protein [Clostridium caldaquaticum]